jgi:hypothetical protein
MTAILFASSSVTPHRLQVSIWEGTNPNALPRGRNDEGSDSPQVVFIFNQLPVRRDVDKIFSLWLPYNPAVVVGYVLQSSSFCRFIRIEGKVESRFQASCSHTGRKYAINLPTPGF